MKQLIAFIMLLHGAIHLIGFVKGFNLAEVQSLQSSISKTSALVWLMVFLLFTMSAMFFLFNQNVWMFLAGTGLLLSTCLIIINWSDAKYGMIPNVIIAIVMMFSFASCAFNRKIARETQEILHTGGLPDQEVITTDNLEELPLPVKRWLMNSGVVGKSKPQTVYLTQRFEMKLKPDQDKWYEAFAKQYFTTENPAFIWTVKLNMSQIMQIRGRDKFVNGKGEMQMKMYSLINLGKESGEKMDEATLQRYLGEMVWFPSALLNPYVVWEGIDSLSAKATMTYGGTTGSGIFHFNEAGDFVGFSTMRYMGNEPDAKRHEWIISVDDYAVFEGIRIPSKMRSTWKLDEGDWTWCILEITGLLHNNNY